MVIVSPLRRSVVLAKSANASVSFHVLTSSVCVENVLQAAEIRAFMDVSF